MTTTPITVQQFMTRSPAMVNRDLSLVDAKDRMFANNLRHLPVMDGGKSLVGVLTDRDVALAIAFSGDKPATIPVSRAMTADPFTCGPTAQLETVAQEMEAHGYGCAIVVGEHGYPIGVFTTTDALRALRQLITGKPAEPARASTHTVEHPEERPVVDHPRVPRRAGTGSNTGNMTPTS